MNRIRGGRPPLGCSRCCSRPPESRARKRPPVASRAASPTRTRACRSAGSPSSSRVRRARTRRSPTTRATTSSPACRSAPTRSASTRPTPSTQVEQGGVIVVGRQDGARQRQDRRRGPGGRPQQTYVITGRPPGDRRRQRPRRRPVRRGLHPTSRSHRTYGDVIERAPGAFVDPSGNVSIGGATGLENIYIVNGINVTGIEYGNLEAGTAVDRRRHQPAARVPDTRSTSTAAAIRPSTAARWAASSTACSSRAATSSTAARSATGRPTGLSGDPTPVTTRRALARLRAQARLRHQHRRRGRRPDHQGQAVLLGRLRAALQRTRHVFRQTYLPLYDPTTRAPRSTPTATPSRSRTPTGAPASPSRARPTTTRRRSTSSRAPSTT